MANPQIVDPTVREDALTGGVYNWAEVTQVWLVQDGKRYLVFGLVDLLPAEIPKPAATPEREFKTKWQQKTTRLYLQRWVVKADDALDWYRRIRKTDELAKDLTEKPIIFGNLKEEPQWPAMIASANVPFTTTSGRLHCLVPDQVPPMVTNLLEDGKALAWLQDRLHFDLQFYDEWLGSLHLFAQNPVLRTYQHKLGRMADEQESSDFSFIVRKGQSLAGLTLTVHEQRPLGPVAIKQVPIRAPFIRILHKGRVEEVGLSISSDRFGLLDYLEPLPFLRSMQVSLGVTEENRQVTVPSSGGADETYETRLSRYDTPMVVGEKSPPPDPGKKLRAAQKRRETQQLAERHGQKWFNGDKQEAREFVRKIIGSARERVLIIDPYLASVEVFRFALAVTGFAVKSTIVSSAEVLKRPDQIKSDQRSGEVLKDQLDGLEPMQKITALVLTGDRPAIHDRFLIIDDTVWLSGNSLNDLGHRASMMTKLLYPEPVIERLSAIINGDRCKSLEDWLATLESPSK